MSHATGEVFVRDDKGLRRVGRFEYNGTCDLACTRISETEAEMDAAWRSPENMATCTCGKPPTAVVLRTNYGNGSAWESHACLACRAITGHRNMWDAMEELGASEYGLFGVPLKGNP